MVIVIFRSKENTIACVFMFQSPFVLTVLSELSMHVNLQFMHMMYSNTMLHVGPIQNGLNVISSVS